MNSEEWIDVKDGLPVSGQRVRAIVVKELIYQGYKEGEGHLWTYDSQGEHGIYSWCPILKSQYSHTL